MKTVTGKIVSSAPVSLSKAAKIISKFAETEDNGASQAVKAYLRRSAAAFNELKKLHRELEASSKNKHKKVKSDPAVEAAEEPSQEPVQLSEDGERKRHRKKKNKAKNEDAKSGDHQVSLIVEDKEKPSEETKHRKEERIGGEVGAGESNGSQLKHKKKRKDSEINDKEDGSSQKTIEEHSEGRKHKKEKKSGAQVDGGQDGGEVETKEGKKKKRKRRELEEEKENVSAPTPDLKQSEEKKKQKKDKGGDQVVGVEDGVKNESKEGTQIDLENGNDSSETQHKKKKKRRKAEAEG